MLKTVKNGSGIPVDPPPLFFQNSHILPSYWGERPEGGNSWLEHCNPWLRKCDLVRALKSPFECRDFRRFVFR